jgi:CBS domain-containing protein
MPAGQSFGASRIIGPAGWVQEPTTRPLNLDADASIMDAARAMKEHAIGGVMVENDRICGIASLGWSPSARWAK